jgi:hypothetical protein
MTPAILRRCSICNQFHASYLVPGEQGETLYLCTSCWEKRFNPAAETNQEGERKNKQKKKQKKKR